MFERLPLAEWNNRILPITAEIAWSGERPATVRNASVLPHDGGTTFQRPGMAVDFARGYIYLEGNGGMHRIRTRDLQEDLHVTEAQMGAEISPKLLDSKGNIYSTSPSSSSPSSRRSCARPRRAPRTPSGRPSGGSSKPCPRTNAPTISATAAMELSNVKTL